MKNLFTLTLLYICTTICTVAQEVEKPNLPINEKTNQVTYDDVVTVEGASQKELFANAGKWFRSYFKNPANVIQSEDTTEWMIYGKSKIRTYWFDKKGDKYPGPNVRYKIKVYMKEGRYKYVLSDFRYEDVKLEPMEDWIEATEDLQEKYFKYLIQVDSAVKIPIAGGIDLCGAKG